LSPFPNGVVNWLLIALAALTVILIVLLWPVRSAAPVRNERTILPDLLRDPLQ
jgi:hypothetical protein